MFCKFSIAAHKVKSWKEVGKFQLFVLMHVASHWRHDYVIFQQQTSGCWPNTKFIVTTSSSSVEKVNREKYSKRFGKNHYVNIRPWSYLFNTEKGKFFENSGIQAAFTTKVLRKVSIFYFGNRLFLIEPFILKVVLKHGMFSNITKNCKFFSWM